MDGEWLVNQKNREKHIRNHPLTIAWHHAQWWCEWMMADGNQEVDKISDPRVTGWFNCSESNFSRSSTHKPPGWQLVQSRCYCRLLLNHSQWLKRSIINQAWIHFASPINQPNQPLHAFRTLWEESSEEYLRLPGRRPRSLRFLKS